MNSWVQAYIDLQIYWGLGLGLNCQDSRRYGEGERGTLEAETAEAGADRQTEEKEQISTVKMSLLGDVAMATGSPRHNARRAILKEVSLRPRGGGWGLPILSQGHSERRVILMMILMGSNGGKDRHRPTHLSLKSL